MPHSISAAKRIRQIKTRTERNKALKSRLKSARRAFLKAVEAGDAKVAREKLVACEKLLKRAANRGPIHRNTASRTVSRMQKRLKGIGKAPAAEAK
jgi:small subunit ribosomal protein S20